MKTFYTLLLITPFLIWSCGEDDPVEEPEPEFENVVSAKINSKDFYADEAENLDIAITNGNYRVKASDLPQSMRVVFKGEPEVKTYTLTGKLDEDGAYVVWSASNLTTEEDHVVYNGTLEVRSYENRTVKAFFEGTARRVSEPYPEVQITKGTVDARWP